MVKDMFLTDIVPKSESILDALGWSIIYAAKRDADFFVEIQTSAPAGEDFLQTLWFDGTESGFAKAVQDAAKNFEPLEYSNFFDEAHDWEALENARAVQSKLEILANALKGFLDETESNAKRDIHYRQKSLKDLFEMYAGEQSRVNKEDAQITMDHIRNEVCARVQDTFKWLAEDGANVDKIYRQFIEH